MTTPLLRLPAPAKLNLFLHITGRRADGYHELESVFVPISWADSIDLHLRADGQIARADVGSLALPPDDLCTRAARALQEASGTRQGCDITLEKRLPAQAGLGGGSSDAATCLLGLNQLWGLKLPLAELQRIGLALGADVPFFLGGRPAFVSGIGERLQPFEPPAALLAADCWVLKPAAGLETSSIFRHPELARQSEPATIAGFAADPFGYGRNQLQSVATTICSDVGQALIGLSQHLTAHGVALLAPPRMTGSGSAVFAFGHAPANLHLPELPSGWCLQQCRVLAQHPIHEMLVPN